MTKIGLGLPGLSIGDVQRSAAAAAQYAFDSFSVYGDLGDLPPYAALHAIADLLRGSRVRMVGPMGVPVGMQHPELIAQHARALTEQLPGQSFVGLVRGAFLEQIGERPASLGQMRETVQLVRSKVDVPIYFGGFGPRILGLAGELDVAGVKMGGSTNLALAERSRKLINNDGVALVLGAVSVVDRDGAAARRLARMEVGKYLDVVGGLDPTLDEDQRASLAEFRQRFAQRDSEAYMSIADGLLDNFAMAGTPEEVAGRIDAMRGRVDRFELGTPHGLTDRPTAIRFIGDSILRELGE